MACSDHMTPQAFSNDAERALIASTPSPRTRQSLAADLAVLGLQPGSTVIVHSSLRSLGWVVGGAVTFIHSLMDAVTENGTIVMPTQSTDYTDPAGWRHPPVPEAWHDGIRASMPPFDPARTPTRRMGTVPELFRTWPGVLRSNHPSGSFAAWGRHAAQVTERHGPQRIGEESPMAELYRLDGLVLLAGVGFERNTSFHLAEYRVKSTKYVDELMPLVMDGSVEWTVVREIEFAGDETLKRIGADFEASGAVGSGNVGSAQCRLFRARTAVDFAQEWLGRNIC